MKTRTLTGAVMVAVLIPFFIFSHTVAFPILLAALTAQATWELFRCIGQEKNLFAVIPAYAVGIFGQFAVRYLGQNDAERIAILALFCFALFVWELTAAVFSKGKYPVTEAAVGGMMTVYITCGLAALTVLRIGADGAGVYLIPFLLPWISDTFAYLVGRKFGKHKLIPDVSPKKTIEGSIGGIVFSILVAVLYGMIVGETLGWSVDYLMLAVAGGVVSVISQCGDLIASLIKRHYGIKDYGKLLPGHGGILDRFDSVLITAPFVLMLEFLMGGSAIFH